MVAAGFAAACVVGVVFAELVRGAAPSSWNYGLPWEHALLGRLPSRLPAPIDAVLVAVPLLATNLTLIPVMAVLAWWLWTRRRQPHLAIWLAVTRLRAAIPDSVSPGRTMYAPSGGGEGDLAAIGPVPAPSATSSGPSVATLARETPTLPGIAITPPLRSWVQLDSPFAAASDWTLNPSRWAIDHRLSPGATE